MVNKSLEQNRVRIIVLIMLTSLVSFIAFLSLALYIFDMVDVWIILLSAILSNLIQISLIKGLMGKLKNLVIQANELEIRLGYQTRNMSADDFVGCNATYAKMMLLNAAIALVLPWVFVFTSLII